MADTSQDGGTLPNQGQMTGGKGPDGKFHFISVDATGATQIAGGGAGTPATTVVSTALEASRVLKNAPGSLVSVSWLNTKAAPQYLLIMNAASVPADGAVVLLYPPILMPAGSNGMVDFKSALAASTGIAISNSSTGTFTKTIGAADCIFSGQVI